MFPLLPSISAFLSAHPKGVLVVTGPTCSGKTNIAVKIAHSLSSYSPVPLTKGVQEWQEEIINADSRQMFADLSTTTASPTEEEKQGVPHHLFETLCPDTPITVVEWKTMAETKIAEVLSRGNIPILCGGTGLYLNALTKGFLFGTCPPNPALRSVLDTFSHTELWERLHSVDPEKAQKIGPQNKKYLIRALEIFEILQKPDAPRLEAVAHDFFLVGVVLPRKILYEKINARVEKMFAEGFLEEVEALLKKYPSVPAEDSGFQAHGVPEAIQYFQGKISREDLKEKMKQNTRKYAKRQLTWWRRDERVHWILGDTEEEVDIMDEQF
ncbi:MAG: tRNA (adenosine(37)-N6)-dimethylallyltransferase MiaA [Candidatus Peregrinibacteria bacterium]